ncbi:hypothetical protein L7F22_039730 [Adiantum nelumboides]|nr:hypothetical protein [Adiantum nelumboides]
MVVFGILVVIQYILVGAATAAASTSCLAKEREALIDLRNSAPELQRPQWNMSDADCCGWAGIECDEASGQVIHISLTLLGGFDDYDVPQDCGALPSSIAYLSALQTLSLSGSCFSGFPSPFPAIPTLTLLDLSSTLLNSLPPELPSSLPLLTHLNLANTRDLIALPLPPQWGNLSRLQYLELGGSGIFWNLSNCDWSSLTHLGISSNFFPLPPVFSSLPSCLQQVIPNLQYLDMSYVDMSGFPGQSVNASTLYDALQSLLVQATNLTQLFLSGIDLHDPNSQSATATAATWSQIPQWLRLIGPQLRTLHVSQCKLQGDVHPTWFAENMLQLKDFEASNNLLTGSLSSLLSPNMSALEHLDLSLNRLSSVGDLPAFPSAIRYISLPQNRINGEIPVSALSNASNHLQYLDLSRNLFSGPLPFSSSSEWSSITYLDLSNNQFSGRIADSVGNMSLVSQFSLSYNQLSGCLPESLGNLLSLSSSFATDGFAPNGRQPGLFLNGNNFSCGIPLSLGRLRSLLQLDLSKNNLEGMLPTSFSNLTGLNLLDLSFNKFGGNIPSTLCNVSTKSHGYAISLSANQFLGTIPTCLVAGISASSVMLDISNNLNLSGSLPPSVWSGLITGTFIYSFYLDVSNNQISGSLPASIIYNQTVSVFVDASYNKLSGSLPSNLAQNCLYGGFQWYLADNVLSGQLLPSFINNITCSWIETTYGKYATIALQNNLISGTIPESLGFLGGLRYLALARNNFSGSIPASLANAKSLQFFDASYNKLKGNIPNFGDGTPYLWALILKENELDGTLPPSLTNISLAVLDVSRNHLSGIIPFTRFVARDRSSLPTRNEATADQYRWSALRLKQIIAINGNVGMMGSLTDMSLNAFSQQNNLNVGFFSMNMSHNMLSGPIPKGIANLSELEWLDLSNNQLAGTIPNELLELTSLSSLNFSYNPGLEGPIPQGAQFSTFNNDSFIGNPALCGPPLSKSCNFSAEPPAVQAEQLGADSSLLSRIQEKVSLEGVGIGYALSFVVVGYLINRYLLYPIR